MSVSTLSPLRFRGVTFSDTPTEENFTLMREMGVETIRVWGVGDDTPELLRLAEKFKIAVMVGLWMRHGRAGAEGDDTFDWEHDIAGKQLQWNQTLEAVMRYKECPAVAVWCIGNEVILNIASEEAKQAYAKVLEQLCQAVKIIDPGRLVASVSAWLIDVPYWMEYCPSLDLYGINTYGYGAFELPSALARLGSIKPYFLGEFGASGEWECEKDANGVTIEPTDRQKFEIFADAWPKIEQAAGNNLLGAFFFNFAREGNFAGIWLNFFIGDFTRASYWGARAVLSGKGTPEHFPWIDTFTILSSESAWRTGGWIQVELIAKADLGTCILSFHWNQRQGSREKRDSVAPLVFHQGESSTKFWVNLPDQVGPIKIYVFLKSGERNLAIASQSVFVAKFISVEARSQQ